MSSDYGQIFKDGKPRGYFLYSGTASCACTRIYLSREDLRRNWDGDNSRECTCGAPSENVILSTVYGPGFNWDSTACFVCMSITGPVDGGPELIFSSFDDQETRYTQREGPYDPDIK